MVVQILWLTLFFYLFFDVCVWGGGGGGGEGVLSDKGYFLRLSDLSVP